MIPEGMRAISVRVNEVVGVAGFVVPGTLVDVLVTVRRSGRKAGPADDAHGREQGPGGRLPAPKDDQEKSKSGEPISYFGGHARRSA